MNLMYHIISTNELVYNPGLEKGWQSQIGITIFNESFHFFKVFRREIGHVRGKRLLTIIKKS